MRVVIQRVKEASVEVTGEIVSKIGGGFLILLGIASEDSQEDIDWLCAKIAKLRVFEDQNDAMNNSILDVHGDIIVVSQFTLHASVKKGNRPSFIKAARPEVAIPLYEAFINKMETELGKKVQTGVFGAMMDVALVNDGPVTIVIDSKNRDIENYSQERMTLENIKKEYPQFFSEAYTMLQADLLQYIKENLEFSVTPMDYNTWWEVTYTDETGTYLSRYNKNQSLYFKTKLS